MKHAIKHAESRHVVRITHDGSPIDAHWNFFNTIDEARQYFDKEMVKLDGDYGIQEIDTNIWAIMEKKS